MGQIMKIALYYRYNRLGKDLRLRRLCEELEEAGHLLYRVTGRDKLTKDTDMLVSVGGDGTFLSASALVGDTGVPVLGVNLGRLGFLSENRPESVAESILSGAYTIEDRTLLDVGLSSRTGCEGIDSCHFALNEMTVHRSGAAMLGVDVSLDGVLLPTYWADGLLVATSSGSTAYSLSVGGPIVMPETKVLIISPIASHNLNVRPLVVPDTSKIGLKLKARDSKALLTLDNRTVEIDPDMEISVSMARFFLKRVRLNSSNFINALTGKLFWGEDIRNNIGK